MDLGLAGWVANAPDGSVAVVAEGSSGALDDLEVETFEIRPVAGREVVEHADVVAPLDERIHEIRADEPGSACHQCLHPCHFP